MANDFFTYCLGTRCGMKANCSRYVEGRRLPNGDWRWMEHCDVETRDGYIKYT